MAQPRDYATELRIEEHALERVRKQYAQGTVGHSAVSRQEQRVVEAQAALAKSKEGPQMDSATKLDAACAKLDSLARNDADLNLYLIRCSFRDQTSGKARTTETQVEARDDRDAVAQAKIKLRPLGEISITGVMVLRQAVKVRIHEGSAYKDAAPATKLDAACAKVDALVRKDADEVHERYRQLQAMSTEKLRQLAGPGKESAGWRELLEVLMKKEFSASDLRAWAGRRTAAAKQ